ncbi:hypothetical protein [Marinivivus vitaminiproducens]|uniref:hypothetical protein n=1 Tax=Marinivivus vitaminiproducens TaxID=3035935 RepID=UPI002798CCE7|nr:hypothetical protein P4R82_11020 [Geminicoccaceae bacterium SCSIO 64248]
MRSIPLKHRLPLGVALVVLAASATPRPVLAQGVVTEPPSQWQLTISPYLWAAGLDGDVSVGSIDGELEQDFDDILDDLVFGGMLLVDARKDRYGIAFNSFFVRTQSDADSGGLSASLESDTAAFQLSGYYQALTWRPRGDDGFTVAVEPYAGARLTYIRNELQGRFDDGAGAVTEREADRNETWVDPVVGTRLILHLGERWSFRLAGDIGGFGLGSDLSWAAQGLLGYTVAFGRFNTVLGVGYQALSWDYDDDDFEWDVTQHGPVIGAAIQF